MREIAAEEIMGAALDMGFHDELLDALMDEFEATDWVRIEGKAYPPSYAMALGRYRAHPDAVARMRRELATIPRFEPDEYDILFNIDGGNPAWPGPTWDVVKWMKMPEYLGYIPGHGHTAVVLLEPYPVYDMPAWRSPLSMSHYDFNRMRRNSTTLREGGRGIDRELVENNLKRQADRARVREDEDRDFADYYRDLFRKQADELGV